MVDRISPLQRDIELLVQETMSPEAQATYLREHAEQEHKRALAQNEASLGYRPDHDLFVDGVKQAAIGRLTVSSKVVFEYHLLVDVIEFVDGLLQLHSPVLSGTYQASHIWFADDKEFDINNVPPAEQYVVINAQPYARKIERGLSRMAPDGVYEGVSILAKRRYGNVAYVGYGYRSFPGGAIGAWAQSASARKMAREVRGGRPSLHEEWLTRQPAIIIDPGRN